MEQRIFSFIIEENADILTMENIRFALEGCYPQLKIGGIAELEPVEMDFVPVDDPMEKFNDSLTNLKKVWNEEMEKLKKRMSEKE